MEKSRTWSWLASSACLFALAACQAPSGELEVVKDDHPAQPEVTTEATEAMRAAPSRSSAREDGACATQDDCAADEVCLAVTPGEAECVPASDVDVRPPPRGPLGQPAPPIGLLDGRAMRDHVERSGP